MEQKNVSKRVTATILSMSLLTVMAGAAIAPALGIIKAHFASAPDLLVQLIVSMPALLIIITNIFFLQLVRRVRTRTIATIGLLLYVAAGAGCFFVDEIHVLLLMRALLGVSVGLIMPLSTGLLAYYFPPERQARLMGLSAAMNQMGGVIATLLDCSGDGMVVAARCAIGFIKPAWYTFQAQSTAEVPSIGNRHVAADDPVLHLSHQLRHHRQQADRAIGRGDNDDHGGT